MNMYEVIAWWFFRGLPVVVGIFMISALIVEWLFDE
jgi:hypothetical protein